MGFQFVTAPPAGGGGVPAGVSKAQAATPAAAA
jgi:hypothetical protein